MVLLASIAVKQSFEGGEMAWQITKLVAYLILWFVAGIMLIPTLFKTCRKYLNDETMTILSLGLCLGMVLLAIGAGFSAALGAFVMGSILAETVEAERVERLVGPVKNMFGAVFFTSVGMMIDPALLLQYWFPITLITLSVILGQIIFATTGIVLSGQPLKTAMQSAFALTQVGEFAFIIANFGNDKGITEPYLYPVIVAVSVITTFLTPYTIKLAEPAYEKLDKVLPRRWKLMLEMNARKSNSAREESVWKRLIKKTALSITLYTVTSIFVISLYFTLVNDPLVDFINGLLPADYEWVGRLVSLLIILSFLSLFIFKIATKHLVCEESKELWKSDNIRRGGIIALTIGRLIICLILIVTCISQLFAATYGVLLAIALVVIIASMFSKRVQLHSAQLESNFMSNLSAREQAMREGKKQEPRKAVLDSDEMHFYDVLIPAQSPILGRTLRELDLRNLCGVNVIRILRQSGNVNTPAATEKFQVNDKVVVSGSLEDIELFKLLVLGINDISKDPS